MKYLVDANVLSEPTKPAPNSVVVEWLKSQEHEIVVDPIILGELRFGILLLPAGKRRSRMEKWFVQGAGRLFCLPWDRNTGLRWAKLIADLRTSGQSMPVKDSLIAATALIHDLILVTRNNRDFLKAGIEVLNPFD